VSPGGDVETVFQSRRVWAEFHIRWEEGTTSMFKGVLTAWMALAAMSPQVAGDGGSVGEAVLSLGRTLSADFWAGRLDPVWTRMSPGMQKGLGSIAGLATARADVLAIAGGPGEVIAERVQEFSGNLVYLRTFRVTQEGELRLFQEQWAIQESRTVVGFYVRPPRMFLQDAP
jgi:hypothetical protein